MILKVNKDDWYINVGIVGFINIMGLEKITVHDEHIEFNSDLLKSFGEKYINYFLNKYDVAKSTKEEVDMILHTIHKNGLDRHNLKRIKTSLSYQVDKLKKIDNESHELLSELIKNTTTSNTYEELTETIDIVISVLSKKHINDRITLNKLRFILKENFFGQTSFLNVSKSTLSPKETGQLINKDYVLAIDQYATLIDTLEDSINNDNDKLFCYIKESLEKENISNKLLLSNINKRFIEKDKSLLDIKSFINSKIDCPMCESYIATQELSEKSFATLGVSNTNARNFFWNLNFNKKVCPMCRLILLCIPAGVKYQNNGMYSFVNIEGTLNEIISENIKLEKSDNIVSSFLHTKINAEKQICKWQLSNTLFIEFFTNVTRKENRLNYFHIPYHTATFFSKNIDIFSSIKNKIYQNEVIDKIMKNENLLLYVNTTLRDIISGKNKYIHASDCYKTLKIFYKLKNIGDNMNKIQSMNETGKMVREVYISSGSENKIIPTAYKVLNLAKKGKEDEVANALLSIIMQAKIEINSQCKMALLDIMSKNNTDTFISLAQAFVCGLASKETDSLVNTKSIYN